MFKEPAVGFFVRPTQPAGSGVSGVVGTGCVVCGQSKSGARKGLQGFCFRRDMLWWILFFVVECRTQLIVVVHVLPIWRDIIVSRGLLSGGRCRLVLSGRRESATCALYIPNRELAGTLRRLFQPRMCGLGMHVPTKGGDRRVASCKNVVTTSSFMFGGISRRRETSERARSRSARVSGGWRVCTG